MPHTAPEAAPSVGPAPAPTGTNETVVDASMPVMLHVAAAPVLVANPAIAVGAAAVIGFALARFLKGSGGRDA